MEGVVARRGQPGLTGAGWRRWQLVVTQLGLDGKVMLRPVEEVGMLCCSYDEAALRADEFNAERTRGNRAQVMKAPLEEEQICGAGESCTS